MRKQVLSALQTCTLSLCGWVLSGETSPRPYPGFEITMFLSVIIIPQGAFLALKLCSILS